LQFRDDVYGYDMRMKEIYERDARELSKRRHAEASIEMNDARSLSLLQRVINKFKRAGRRAVAHMVAVLP
jgi:hypothetical protein